MKLIPYAPCMVYQNLGDFVRANVGRYSMEHMGEMMVRDWWILGNGWWRLIYPRNSGDMIGEIKMTWVCLWRCPCLYTENPFFFWQIDHGIDGIDGINHIAGLVVSDWTYVFLFFPCLIWCRLMTQCEHTAFGKITAPTRISQFSNLQNSSDVIGKKRNDLN